MPQLGHADGALVEPGEGERGKRSGDDGRETGDAIVAPVNEAATEGWKPESGLLIEVGIFLFLSSLWTKLAEI